MTRGRIWACIATLAMDQILHAMQNCFCNSRGAVVAAVGMLLGYSSFAGSEWHTDGELCHCAKKQHMCLFDDFSIAVCDPTFVLLFKCLAHSADLCFGEWQHK